MNKELVIKYDPDTVLHPGETLSEKLSEMEIGPKEFAVRTDKPEKTISEILSGKSAITPDMAIQFEKVLRIPARFWLKNQADYDEYIARKKSNENPEKNILWANRFPLRQMYEYKWISCYKPVEKSANDLLDFFGMASSDSWKNFYLEENLKVLFRISLKNSGEPEAISAWLRKGELDSKIIKAPNFDERKLKENLSVLKELMYKEPSDLYKQIFEVCIQSGVKFILTESLKNAPISGAVRWINDNPVIQLSCRYKWNDIFWFTFFHEIGHILLHGKKDFFLEDVNYRGRESVKEKEADEFAIKNTFNSDLENEFLKAGIISADRILNFSKKNKVNPAIIVGRLQRRGKIKYSDLNRLRKKLEISK